MTNKKQIEEHQRKKKMAIDLLSSEYYSIQELADKLGIKYFSSRSILGWIKQTYAVDRIQLPPNEISKLTVRFKIVGKQQLKTEDQAEEQTFKDLPNTIYKSDLVDWFNKRASLSIKNKVTDVKSLIKLAMQNGKRVWKYNTYDERVFYK